MPLTSQPNHFNLQSTLCHSTLACLLNALNYHTTHSHSQYHYHHHGRRRVRIRRRCQSKPREQSPLKDHGPVLNYRFARYAIIHSLTPSPPRHANIRSAGLVSTNLSRTRACVLSIDHKLIRALCMMPVLWLSM